MYIKSIILENFQCYYDVNPFELANGLNIILGDNGEGKTKFYDAVQWLLNGSQYNLEELISKKKIKENHNGDAFLVSVTMVVYANSNKKTIKKYFEVIVNKDGVLTSKWKFEGRSENNKGERENVNAEMLLEEIFPASVRRYSMFKGESDLDIFKDGEEALSNLIKSFSNAKFYDKYCTTSKYLRKKSEKAVDDETKRNSKKQKELRELEHDLIQKSNKLRTLHENSNSNEKNLEKTQKSLNENDKHFHNADNLNTLKKRITNLRDKEETYQRQIVSDFTTRLFDDKWILMHYENIQKEFSDKVKNFDKKRRDAERDFDVKRGKNEQIKEILEEYTPLPPGVPSIQHMEEMIEEQICKVCNRTSKKGSDSYNYMLERLKQFTDSQKAKAKDTPPNLFEYNFTQKLFSLSDNYSRQLNTVREKLGVINDVFDFNNKHEETIASLQNQLESEEKEIRKIIASSKSEFDLISIHKNSRKWESEITEMKIRKTKYDSEIGDLKREIAILHEKKDLIDDESASSFLIETRKILRDIEIIFNETREEKYNEFITNLQEKANEIFMKINVDDFHGNIKLEKRGNDRVIVQLYEKERLFKSPNTSLETTMHMSILFAISELATELSDGADQYPMIFDAPTSSFGLKKTSDFLNLVSETGKQRIILTYEFISRDDNGNQVIDPEFEDVNKAKAFWLRRDKFDKNDQSTINTNVTIL